MSKEKIGMFCINCGMKINESHKFCYNCGQSVINKNQEKNEEFNKETIDNASIKKEIDTSYRKKNNFFKNHSFIKKLIISIIISAFCGIGGYFGGVMIISEFGSSEMLEFIVRRDLISEAKDQAETSLEKRYIKSDEFKEYIKEEADYIVNRSYGSYVGYYLEDLLEKTFLEIGIYSGVIGFVLYWYNTLKKKKRNRISENSNNISLINNNINKIHNDNNNIAFNNINEKNYNENTVNTKSINSMIMDLVEKSKLSKIVDRFEKKFKINREKIRYDKIIYTIIMVALTLIVNKIDLLRIESYYTVFNLKQTILIFSGIIAGSIVGAVYGSILVIYDFTKVFLVWEFINFPYAIINLIFFALVGFISRPVYLFIKSKLFKNSIKKNMYVSFFIIPISIVFFSTIIESIMLGVLIGGVGSFAIIMFLSKNAKYIKYENRINILSIILVCLISTLIFSLKYIVASMLGILRPYSFTEKISVLIEHVFYTPIVSVVVILGIYLSKFILEKISQIVRIIDSK